MNPRGSRFDPSELVGVDGVDLSDAELADMLATARLVEGGVSTDFVSPSGDFEDRVMAAIRREPPTRAARGGILAAIGRAWHVATTGGQPLSSRAQAMAFVILLGLAAISIAGIGAAGVGSLLSQPTSAPPSVVPPSLAPAPSPTPSPTPSPSPSPSASATERPSPTESSEPTEIPDATETPDATQTLEPDETPDATDDNSGPGGGGGGSPGPGGGGSAGSGGPG
jgi:hypothetical protein